MNVFGSFSFGRLIKTFLPGFMILLAGIGYGEAFLLFSGNDNAIIEIATENPVFFVAFSIPFSIIFGIFTNTVTFSYGLDLLVRRHHQKENGEFYEYESTLKSSALKHYADCLFENEGTRNQFMKYCDFQYFTLRTLPLEKFLFLEDSYWYYLEFQLNTILALCFGAPVFIGTLSLFLWSQVFSNLTRCVILSFAVLLGFCCLRILLKAARINFDRYKKKNLSLLIAHVYAVATKG